MPWPLHLPIHWLQSESRGLPLSLTSRGRQSDKEFGREITHQGACLLRRASNQLRNNNCIAETYAFLPREAVTRFLMSCTECQKRMHFNSNGLEPKENEPPSPLVSGIIDYNMPLTSTYLKQMKLRVMNSQEQPDCLSEKDWVSATHLPDHCPNPESECLTSCFKLSHQLDRTWGSCIAGRFFPV
ncbi:hypothetical protein FD755_004927 [Muntiacus reevesi]|uniref:Integrase zinc-binding domain-containing protein n=1 Tax=Muntiacus reevesi TaxID=9886 RepID=A0A5J5MRX9_MUNRE|nr:hypothetical protein FD755_004927 [Muntiacus reevesi]